MKMQYGGEGKGSYSGKSGSGKFSQHGGEGSESTGTKKVSGLFKPNSEYCGPGRGLTTNSMESTYKGKY